MNVSLYGAGQVSNKVATILHGRAGVEVAGPYGRSERERALRSGAEVVVIATTSFLREAGPDIRTALEAGSNVITTAEEAAYPWAVEPKLADELDALARERGLTVLGCGLNPGFAFDALVLTAAGAAWEVESIRVERVVDLSGFGSTVLRRIGVGYTPEEFEAGKQAGRITGHIGFPQSMSVVANKLGLVLGQIDREIEPLLADRPLEAGYLTVAPGCSGGFRQRYLGWVEGKPWFECLFTGHVDLEGIGLEPRDEIWIEGPTPLHYSIMPGLNPQVSAPALVANSLRRVVEGPPGWVTVGDLPPATPCL
jgi:4-hydroxy-tetrahydrodipicolinate reductase